jgi:predicted HTH domain antitoxin
MRQEPIGIRLPQDVLKRIEQLSKEENEDRSTVIRKLVIIGYADIMKQRAMEKYKKGVLSFSEAAKQAGLTLWEMERFLVEQGFVSSYSVDDLESDLRRLQD